MMNSISTYCTKYFAKSSKMRGKNFASRVPKFEQLFCDLFPQFSLVGNTGLRPSDVPQGLDPVPLQLDGEEGAR